MPILILCKISCGFYSCGWTYELVALSWEVAWLFKSIDYSLLNWDEVDYYCYFFSS